MQRVKRGLRSESANETYDLETGEVEDGALVWVPTRARSQFGTEWFQMAQDTLRVINARRKELGFEGVCVFNALMSRLDFENYIQVSQSAIADELNMKRSNVSRAVKKLCDLGFIRRGPKVGKSHTFQLHPELAWKGKSSAHFSAREQARKQKWRVIDGGKSSETHTENDQPDLPFD